MRAAWLAAVVGVVAVACGATPASLNNAHPSRITVLSALPTVPSQLSPALSAALGEADRASLELPSDMGFPWVDRNASQLVIPATSAAGKSAATIILARPEFAQVSHRIDMVRHSRTTLQQIIDGAIGPQPGGRVVFASYPDPQNNRVILEVDQATDALLNWLASHFDPSAIAVYPRGPTYHGGGPA